VIYLHSNIDHASAAMSQSISASTQLVLGSMERGEEYQRLVTTLKEGGGVVQGEMVDRVLDGGELNLPRHWRWCP